MPPVTFRIYLLCDILTNWQGVILKFSLGGGGGGGGGENTSIFQGYGVWKPSETSY